MTSIVSTFSHDADGWTASDGDLARWHGSGGNPGGYISINAGDSILAPEQFLGSEEMFYGGKMSFDVFEPGHGAPTAPAIYIYGDGRYLEAAGNTDLSSTWGHESIKLVGSAWYDFTTNAPATNSEMNAVLATLQQIMVIPGGDGKAGLDNFKLSSGDRGTQQESSPSHAIQGHAFGLWGCDQSALLDHSHLAIV